MYVINIQYDKGIGISKRDFNKLMEIAHAKLGLKWQKEMLPEHFKRGASKKYGYVPRQGSNQPFGSKEWWRSYVGRRQRMAKKRGEQGTDLVYTGASRRDAQFGRVIATGKGLRVTIPARALNFRAHMRREVTAAVEAELKLLESKLQSEFEKQFKALQRQRKTTRTRSKVAL